MLEFASVAGRGKGREVVRRTSLEAYREIEARGLLPAARLRVLRLLAERGRPMTGTEVDTELGRGAHKRLSELERLGCVAERGTIACPLTGRRAIAWEATGELPREEAPVRPARPPEQLGLSLVSVRRG